MLLNTSRVTFLLAGVNMVLQLFHTPRVDHNDTAQQPLAVYHKPPPGVDYTTNETVFGKILNGELPATVWDESEDLLLFQDIHPRAATHGLVIPKRFIESVFELTPADLPLLEEMQEMALEILRNRHGEEFLEQTQLQKDGKGDYNLCFHVPPFNSVDHLHLHVLAPRSNMKWYYRWIKYNTAMRWSVSLDSVMERLRKGLPAVPYQKPKTLSSMKKKLISA